MAHGDSINLSTPLLVISTDTHSTLFCLRSWSLQSFLANVKVKRKTNLAGVPTLYQLSSLCFTLVLTQFHFSRHRLQRKQMFLHVPVLNKYNAKA